MPMIVRQVLAVILACCSAAGLLFLILGIATLIGMLREEFKDGNTQA